MREPPRRNIFMYAEEPRRNIFMYADEPEKELQGDSRSPAVPDPFSVFVKLADQLGKEQELIVDQFIRSRQLLLTETTRSSRARFYDDPLALANQGDALLDNITRNLVTDENRYYEAIWGAWVYRFYYQVVRTPGGAYAWPSSWGVKASGRRVNEALDKVVAELGTDRYTNGQAFVDKYGAYQAKAAEAYRRRHGTLPPTTEPRPNKFSSDVAIRGWLTRNKDEIGKLPQWEKAFMMHRLLEGWVSDDDLRAIETLCNGVTSTAEMDEIDKAIRPRAKSLWNSRHRDWLNRILDRRP
jgi:hypothetical protein